MIVLADGWFLERRTILLMGAALAAVAVPTGLWMSRGHWQHPAAETDALASPPTLVGPALIGSAADASEPTGAAAPVLGTPSQPESAAPLTAAPGTAAESTVSGTATTTAAPTARLLPVAGAASTAAGAPPASTVTVTVRSSDVYLRSGPSKAYYPTGKVQPGQPLTVVSERPGWLEVVPTADQFSWISREFVRPSGPLPSRGVVTGDNVRVRAGSVVTPSSRDTVQGKLARGSVVEILGESDGFYRIRPPAGATVWLSSDLVVRGETKISEIKISSSTTTTTTTTPGKPDVPGATPSKPDVPGATPGKPDATAGGSDPLRAGRPTDADLARSAERPVSGAPPVVADAVAKPEPPPTTRPPASPRSDAEELDSTYAAMQAELTRPVGEQKLAPLVARFRALRAATANPRIQQWCEFYAADLQRRVGLQEAWREAERLRTQFDEDLSSRRPAAVASGSAKPSAEKPTPEKPSAEKPTPIAEKPSEPTRPTRPPPPPPMPMPSKPDAKPTVPDATGAESVELTGYLLESAYWESHRDQLGGAVRYRLVQGPPPEDIYIIWVQAGRGSPDLAGRVGQRVTLRGAKVAIPEHRSHVLLVESVQSAK